jgi:hypothetical protein
VKLFFKFVVPGLSLYISSIKYMYEPLYKNK